MNRKRRQKNGRNHKRSGSTPKPVSLSDQYINRGDQLLASIKDGSKPSQRVKQTLDDSIDALLKGIALDDMDRANDALKRGGLSKDQHEQQINQALDRFNNPGAEAGSASTGRNYIYGLNNELIYIGE